MDEIEREELEQTLEFYRNLIQADHISFWDMLHYAHQIRCIEKQLGISTTDQEVEIDELLEAKSNA